MAPQTLSVDSKNGSTGSKSGSLSTRQALFGSPGRTDLLVLIAGLGRSFPRELARLTTMPMTTIIRTLDDFERAGILVSVRLGGTREVRLNPDYVAAKELGKLLEALVEREPRYRKIIGESSSPATATFRQTTMINEETSLADVAGAVANALRQLEYDPVVVGGSAATLHAPEAYRSADVACSFMS
jgi:hypothetical protein